MTNEELLRERVAKLEVQMGHLAEKIDDTHKKVEELDHIGRSSAEAPTTTGYFDGPRFR